MQCNKPIGAGRPIIKTEAIYDKENIKKIFRKNRYDKSVCFKLDKKQYDMLKEFSKITGIPISEICREVVYDFLLCVKDVDKIESSK